MAVPPTIDVHYLLSSVFSVCCVCVKTSVIVAIVLPIVPEPGVDLFDRLRHMTDEEFFFFCQENSDYTFERNADGTIVTLMGQTGGETGRKNSELIAE